jgi:hypothetical protein
MQRKHLFAALVLFSLATVATAQSSAAPGAAPGSGKTVAGVGEAVGITEAATMTAIDPKNHTVTLQAPDGVKQTYKMSKQFTGKNVKVGDVVAVTAVDAVAISLKGPKSGPAGEMGTGVAAADKNDVGVMDVVRVSAKIKAIDMHKPSVTLLGPAGGTVVVKAKSPKDLEGLKVGDDIDATYTQAVIVDLIPPATK